MPIRSLIFDFDGTLADTESAVLASWQQTFREHGTELPLDAWHAVVGTQNTTPAMFTLLREHVPDLDEDALRPVTRARVLGMLETLGPREGVLDYLMAAAERGLRLGVASSSSAAWVRPHLAKIGVTDYFTAVATGDQHRAKPHPDLFLAALDALGVEAADAIAFEDSPHGVTSAKAAGMACVAVPGPITASLGFEQADLVLPSFAAKPLDELLARFDPVSRAAR